MTSRAPNAPKFAKALADQDTKLRMLAREIKTLADKVRRLEEMAEKVRNLEKIIE